MRPDNTNSVTTNDDYSSGQQQATANIIRGQLDSIYSGRSDTATPQTTPVRELAAQRPTNEPAPRRPVNEPRPATVAAATAPAQILAPKATQTQAHGLKTAPPKNNSPSSPSTTPAASTPQVSADQWGQYHSAWQKYYQLYYERYYANHLDSQPQTSSTESLPTASQPLGSVSVSRDSAMKELRSQIRQKVQMGAEKARGSRHFMPILAGAMVLLIFMFLQYNRLVFGAVAAYTNPGNIDPQNIIVNPSSDINVGPEPRMIIPKINVDAPVVYGIGPDHRSQMTAMEKGIAHFSIPGASAVPGQIGNAVFAAHSSNDAFATGDYKFIFAQNEKLTKGDIIYMNFEGKRYTYSITEMVIVLPSEVGRVQIDTDKPILTLISCVPLGTAEKRLLVFAEQISPSPAGATAAAEDDSSTPAADAIPGQPSPTIFERLFGAS